MKKKIVIVTLAILVVLLGTKLYRVQQTAWNDKFKATGNDWQSPKKIEDYFINSLRMTPEEAKKFADIGVSFYVTKNTTLDAIVGNLAYYGLVRDEKTLRYALENTKDTTSGKDGAIKVGRNRTIDLGYYDLSRNIDTWQIADALLNNPHPIGVEYNYIFMPGDPNAPYGPRPEK